jgi:hypothetical protein
MQPLATETTPWSTEPARSGRLRVLLLDGDRTAMEHAAAELLGAGHVVERCCEPGAVPCHVFMTDPGCPLNRDGVDVALIARDHPWLGRALERGTTCMLRAGIPIALVEAPGDSAVRACVRAIDRLH